MVAMVSFGFLPAILFDDVELLLCQKTVSCLLPGTILASTVGLPLSVAAAPFVVRHGVDHLSSVVAAPILSPADFLRCTWWVASFAIRVLQWGRRPLAPLRKLLGCRPYLGIMLCISSMAGSGVRWARVSHAC